MTIKSTKLMLVREKEGRMTFLMNRDGYAETTKWYERAWRIYLIAACDAYEKGNRLWGLIWARSAKSCQRIAEDLRWSK